MASKNERLVIRRNQLSPSEYLQRDGTWGDLRTARRFASQNAAAKAAEQLGIDQYGIF